VPPCPDAPTDPLEAVDGAAPEQLELVLGCTVDEAFWLLSGREPRTPGRAGARGDLTALNAAASGKPVARVAI
jgi:hypothetical protein